MHAVCPEPGKRISPSALHATLMTTGSAADTPVIDPTATDIPRANAVSIFIFLLPIVILLVQFNLGALTLDLAVFHTLKSTLFLKLYFKNINLSITFFRAH